MMRLVKSPTGRGTFKGDTLALVPCGNVCLPKRAQQTSAFAAAAVVDN